MSRIVRCLTVMALAGALLVVDGWSVAPAGEAQVGPEHPGDVVELLAVSTTPDRRFVDSAGREVLLRGVNVNSLAEYWQGVPGIDPTVPLTDADWDAMAEHGFSVVRLLITWSRVEPTRDVIDEAYLDEVEAAVDAAASHGIYTVIDMHQDAYSAFIATTDPTTCPAGTVPAKGWDGAPAWAVITDGLSTCLPPGADRNASPAVTRAWEHFYDDTDGIRGELAEAWGVVAARFAGRPEVAGYDILNEPENPRPVAVTQPLYEAFLADAIGAIRAAEAGAAFDHVVFVEPALPAADLANGIVIPDPARAGVDVENVAASVHNYTESILTLPGLTIESFNDLIETLTAGIGVPNWGGEYGFWDTAPATLEKARRYAADEDLRRWGGAWWQWRQSCGDPHGVRWDGGVVVPDSGVSTHLNLLGCPDNEDLGPNDAFLDILGRGYPRAAPGRLDTVTSDPTTGVLAVTATAEAAGGVLVVWTPTVDDADHRVTVEGLRDLVEHEVDGGRIVTAVVDAPGGYELRVGGEPLQLPTTPTAPAPTTAPPIDDTGATTAPLAGADPTDPAQPLTPPPPAIAARARPGRPTYTG